jgi:hypothetical protein
MSVINVSTDTGIACTLANNGADPRGPFVVTMTMNGLNGIGAAPTPGVQDGILGVQSYAPPTGVGKTAAAAMTAVGYAMMLAFQASCATAGKAQTPTSLMRMEQLIDFATLATMGAYAKAGGT